MRADILGVERRRRWSSDDKARLVAETLEPAACVSEIARRNDLAPSLLFTWRRQARARTVAPASVFLPVQVTPGPPAAGPPPAKRRRKAAGSIEIDIGSGRRLRVGSDVDAAALARVLDVLERR
ncbi:MAG: transposase [Bradyrhizobium sp.]|uniref:IS66-like element accessory protein TnpA n=1 Tax=Bradyrhizobium sp. TaxID=376 RepID=UPI001D40ACCD|nr:transposase [Bradyrhizobium sp.]